VHDYLRRTLDAIPDKVAALVNNYHGKLSETKNIVDSSIQAAAD
jgi:hypothetical protein